jgi:hypothetical protein
VPVQLQPDALSSWCERRCIDIDCWCFRRGPLGEFQLWPSWKEICLKRLKRIFLHSALTPFILLHTSEIYPTHESSMQITWQYLLQHLKKPSFVVWRLDSQSDNTKPQQQSDNNKQKHWISQIWGCASFFDSIPNAWKLAKLWSVMMRLLLQIMFLGFVWSMCQWHDGAYSAHPCVLCCSLGGVAKIPAWHLRQFNIKEFILCWLSWMILAALHNGQESKTSMLTFRKIVSRLHRQ